MDLGHHYVLTEARTSASGQPAQATLEVTPGRARRFADSLDGVWLPAGLVRPGLSFSGTGRLPRDLVPFTWNASIVSGSQRPTLSLRLTRDEANDLFSPFRRFPIDRDRSMFFTYVIHDASIRDDDLPHQPADQRRVRVDVTGELCLEWGRWRHRVEVKHLVAHLDWTFEPVAGGLKPGCVMTIDAVDANIPRIPFIPDEDALWRKLESAANKSFSKHLGKRVLPAGSPIEATVAGRIGDGVDETTGRAPAHPALGSIDAPSKDPTSEAVRLAARGSEGEAPLRHARASF